MQEVCKIMCECREYLKLNRAEMAERVGVTLPTYVSLEQGSTFSGGEYFALAFEAMGISFGLAVLMAETRVGRVFPMVVDLQMLMAFRKAGNE